MILPTKHIHTKQSLLAVGATLLSHLKRPRTVTALWEDTRELPQVGSFERFSLALDLLYVIGAVDFEDGLLKGVSQ